MKGGVYRMLTLYLISDKLSFIIQSSNSWVVIKEIITILCVLNKLIIGRFYSFLLQIPF